MKSKILQLLSLSGLAELINMHSDNEVFPREEQIIMPQIVKVPKMKEYWFDVWGRCNKEQVRKTQLVYHTFAANEKRAKRKYNKYIRSLPHKLKIK